MTAKGEPTPRLADEEQISRPLVEHRSIHEALASALAQFSDLERNRTARIGASHSYNYTDLASVLGYVRPILGMHGLVLTNPVGMSEGTISVRTRFLFGDGSEDLSPEILFPFSGTPQQFGGIVSYLRRYSTLAACGLATEDADGAETPHSAPSRPPVPPASRQTPLGDRRRDPQPSSTSEDPPTQSQFARLQALFRDIHLSDRDAKLAWVGQILGREVVTTNEVSGPEVSKLIEAAEEVKARDPWALADHPEPEEGYS